MRVETLVAAMNENISLCGRMNIRTDAVIINQCDRNAAEEVKNGERICRLLSYTERGVGRSRNRALDAASGDILLFADEDMHYYDDCEALVLRAFEENPNADAILFNIDTHGGDRQEKRITQGGKMTPREGLAFGMVRVAVKREKLGDIRFSLLFGGGARYGSGEDSIFIQELFKRGLNVYKSTYTIASVDMGESTWFKGYTDKFFFDKGALYGALWGKRAKLMACVAAMRWCVKLKRLSFFKILRQYHKGTDDYRKHKSEDIV